MPKIKISILLYEDGGNLPSSLATLSENASGIDIDLVCPNANSDIEEECEKLRKTGIITSARLLTDAGRDFMPLANELFLTPAEGYVLFLSSRIIPSPGMLPLLVEKLENRPEICGANPVLLAAWENPAPIAFMGAVCDVGRRVHYLYEGLPADSPLAAKERNFQFAHPGALLVRRQDFCAVNGFNLKLDYLAFYDFCLRLAKSGSGFTVAPSSRALLLDRFDSWKFCGIWNSAIRSGRLKAPDVLSNYPHFALQDGLPYKLDPWLNEYADSSFPRDMPSSCAEWTGWRRHPAPDSLLKYLAGLPAPLRREALDLAILLPASLPVALHHYEVEAAKIAASAKNLGLAEIASAAGQWQRGKSRFLHNLLGPGMELLQKSGLYNCSLSKSTAVFNAWIEIGEKFPTVLPGSDWPKIAVVMPVHNPEPEFLRQAVESVLAQDYSEWELCIADDASTDRRVIEMLRDFGMRDPRIKVAFRKENGNISNATNSALELVTAPYAAFLDHDDTLAPEALGIVAQKLAANPRLRFIYSDEDHINAQNVRSSPIFRPDFDGDLFFTGHLCVYETELIRKLGGLQPGLDGSQDFDLALRITEKLKRDEIAHLPHILYHWRIHDKSASGGIGAKPYILEATQKAWLASAKRRGFSGKILPTAKNNFFNIAYNLSAGASCSVIFLADRDNPAPGPGLLKCAESACKNVELLIQPLGRRKAQIRPDLPLLPFAGNGIAAAANAAARAAQGDTLLFLYAGLAPLAGCRPDQLVFHALREEIAVTGGLVWKDELLCSGGWYPDITGYPFLLHRHLPRGRLPDVSWGQFLLARHVLGVSWQCFCVRKKTALADGFLNERLGEMAVADFCLRKIRKGAHILASPFGQWENGRDEMPTPEEMDYIRTSYGAMIRASGIRNANLRAARDDGWTLIF